MKKFAIALFELFSSSVISSTVIGGDNFYKKNQKLVR
jgi:hypothetical protein